MSGKGMQQVHLISMLLGLFWVVLLHHTLKTGKSTEGLSRIFPSHFFKPRPCFCNLGQKKKKSTHTHTKGINLFVLSPLRFQFPFEDRK